MIYNALVIDNSSFFKTGTIRVRIPNYFYGEMHWDLSKSPSDIADGYDKTKNTHKDFDAYIFSPIGGGKNFGAFFLPEPNTSGLIAFIGNAIERGNKCFWLGSIFEPTFRKEEDQQNLDNINIPSDKLTANGPNQDGFVNGGKNSEIYDGALVLRLKSTTIDDIQNPTSDKLDWEKNNTENLVVINKDKVLIHHSSLYDTSQRELSYQEINLTPDVTTITMSSKANSTAIAKTSILSFLNNSSGFGFNLSVTDPIKKLTSGISSLNGKLVINNTIDKDTTSITQDFSGINLAFNGNTIAINKDSVSIAAEKSVIYIIGKEVRMGQGNGHILTSTSVGTFNSDNGMVITASGTLFG